MEATRTKPLSEHIVVLQRTDAGSRRTAVVVRHLADAVLLLPMARHLDALRMLVADDVAR